MRRHVRFNLRGHVCRDTRIDMHADLLNYLRRPYLCLDVLRYMFGADVRIYLRRDVLRADMRRHLRQHLRIYV